MKYRKLYSLVLGVVAVFALSGTSALASPIVVNGGFETGTFAGWTLATGSFGASVTTSNPHSGTYAAQFGLPGSLGLSVGNLSQTLSTVVGQTYNLSFAVANSPSLIEFFDASLGKFQVYAQFGFLAPGTPYTIESFNFTATKATTLLDFNFATTLGSVYLDDVSVTAVPEPASLMLYGTGIICLYGACRRKLHS